MSEGQAVAQAAKEPPTWGRLIGWLGGLVVGVVLLVGGWTKALDPLAFVEQIRAEGLDFLLPAAIVAAIALALEFGLGTALVLGLRKMWVLIPSFGLALFFLFLTGRTYYKSLNGTLEEASNCGCFGNLVDRTPGEAFWQDLALLVPGLVLALFWRPIRDAVGIKATAAAAVTVAALVFAWQAPRLPVDDLATRLGQGVEIADLCSGRDEERLCLDLLAPQLREGRHTVVITDLENPAFTDQIDGLNTLAWEGTPPVVLSSAPQEEHHAFFWQWGPSFEIVEAPEPLIKPLYRTLPRSFVVEDGVVVETYAGMPPLPEPAEDPAVAPTAEMVDPAPETTA